MRLAYENKFRRIASSDLGGTLLWTTKIKTP